MHLRPLIVGGLLLSALACKKPAPAAPAPSRFCDEDLTGVWLNSSDRHFAYRFRDHGGVLRGEYLQRSDDGALTKPEDPVLFELHRTEAALAGVMKMDLAIPSGRKCPVEFGIRVSACKPDALQAVVEMAADFEPDCTRKPADPHLVEYRFERDHPPDAGPAAH